MISTTFTKERKEEYCRELEKHGEPAKARRRVSISHTCVNRHRSEDKEFRLMEQDAMDAYRCEIAEAIHKRGIEGWNEPVYQGGTKVGDKRKFSDALLLAHAKRHIPEYTDRVKIDQTTTVEGDILGLSLEQLSPKSRQLLRQIIEMESKNATEDQ